MEKTKHLFFLLTLVLLTNGHAQTVEIKGKVIASGDVVGIHIINKTASKFTITNDEGYFEMPVSRNDTIIISGIQYQQKEIIIDQIIVQAKAMTVFLEDNVNELDEVLVGKVLTGNLLSDIENSDAKSNINFYDVGIPGYTGKPKTQSERRLYEARSGGGIVPLNPILNWISGRTKKLKKQVAIEAQDRRMEQASEALSEVLFEIEGLNDQKRNEFFYYASEDPKFTAISKINNDLAMLEFLMAKLKAYKLQSEQD